jgi:hypothetical protein
MTMFVFPILLLVIALPLLAVALVAIAMLEPAQQRTASRAGGGWAHVPGRDA